MTGLPDQRSRLRLRGTLKQRIYADLTVFDLTRIGDRMTYQ